MKLYLDWFESVLLSRSKVTGSYELDLEDIPKAAGIYVFARGHGKAIEALYVGKAANLRSRIRQQLNNHRLMSHLGRAKRGVRGVIFAKWRARPGQRSEKCLPLIERSLIRHFVLKGDDLVNKNGVSLRQHMVTSRSRIRGFVPLRLYSDKK